MEDRLKLRRQFVKTVLVLSMLGFPIGIPLRGIARYCRELLATVLALRGIVRLIARKLQSENVSPNFYLQ